MNEIKKIVYSFPTKYSEGFTSEEIKELLQSRIDVNMDKFNDALMGITCTTKDGKLIIYRCDVELALRCGIENRDPSVDEWD